jgi:peptidyl-prolyl cis-trans isomerase C
VENCQPQHICGYKQFDISGIYIFKVPFGIKILSFEGGYQMFRYCKLLGCSLALVLALQVNVFANSDAVVANIGDQKITISDLDKMIGLLDAEKQKLIEKNPQLKESVLTQFVQSMVVSKLAKGKGFDKIADVKDQLDFFKDNFLASLYIRQEVLGKISIPDEDMKKYYDSHKDEFKTPEMVRVRHILVRVDESAPEKDQKAAKKKAESILKKIKSGADFAKLAEEVSEDPGSKEKGGDIGFFQRGRMVKSFEDAAFALKPGEVSGLVKTRYGYHILKLEERKAPAIQSFAEVKETIRQKLIQDQSKSKVVAFIEQAMKDAKAEIHPEALAGDKK